MNSEREDFEKLRRLLTIKRHEQPPPGYFHDFSRQVISRIKAEEQIAADSFLERLIGHGPWFKRLWNGFEAKPILAGAFGVGVCGLLVVGLVSSERMDSNPSVLSSDNNTPQTILANVPGQVGHSLLDYGRASTETGAVFTAQSRSSIFEDIQNPHVQNVSFSVPAH
jgi:hypothetical protein